MHSLRRAALRSAVSAYRALAPKAPAAPFAALLRRSANTTRVCAALAVRHFAQTSRVANIGETRESQTDEEAAQSSEEVSPASGESSESSGRVQPGETPYAIFIRNIVFDANEQHLTEAFEKYGTVSKAAIARDARGMSRGYGFVWFSGAEEMDKAASQADGSFWHGRRIQVAPRIKKHGPRSGGGSKEPTRTIYIGNIPYETTDVELNRLFQDLDGVTDVRVAVDRTTGWPRGFAHADFSDVQSAVKAFSKLQGSSIGGRELRFDYSQTTGRFGRTAPAEPNPAPSA